MVNKKNTLIYSIILLFFIHIIINCIYFLYNNKNNLSYNIPSFDEKQFKINNKTITYYEKNIKNHSDNNISKNIVLIHGAFESSLNSYNLISEPLSTLISKPYNFNIFLIDLPGHGKSFKANNFDYSFRNISSYINSLMENLNITDALLICNNFSSSIGLNMISLNDKIFSEILLIDPVFDYNSMWENFKLFSKNKLSLLPSFIILNLNNSSLNLNKYITSYFNNKNSSNKYASKMIKDSTPISTLDIKSNIPIFALINNKKYFNSSYIKNLSNRFSSILFSPYKYSIEDIINSRFKN
ncbi:alpha/beta fold hydrolase [Candidatus Arthromitus sp. SFB-rat-Yit]|uniref:alpha/beta fold hydrolase n=1 Tax=Candidatus Arthromitus sp. SFB-rat-Yit TaxID=1041504 RepID=UPI000227A119|nr:alpha/beta fold hydrolase [Candidatus Arthromitus sp. SFB-rat-Yit]BAK81856.1 putative alpha/beta hydrolase [Candidatus Arthromitus sp. SFB-rat-Yit]